MDRMTKRTWLRLLATILVLVTTVVVFVRYFAQHPEVRHQLDDTSPGLLLGLVVLYILYIGSIAAINSGTVRLCRIKLSASQNVLLSMYSGVINFFGPLQSGPAFRGFYLKKMHGIKLRDYTVATFVYYLFYAAISGLFLLSGVLGWWLVPLSVMAILILWRGLHAHNPVAQRFKLLDLSVWYVVALATLVQACIQVVIYYLELRSIGPGVHLSQAVIYTGAANFALFVSITPGAIGFRESFLLFSQNLHHIQPEAIVVASTLDRAAYVIVLLLAAAYIFGSHANRQFRPVKN